MFIHLFDMNFLLNLLPKVLKMKNKNNVTKIQIAILKS